MGTWTALEAIGTLLTGLVAIGAILYAEYYKPKFRGPRLKVEHENRSPFNKVVTPVDNNLRPVGGPQWWARLRVRNAGHSTAHRVIGRLVEVWNSGTGERVEQFDPCTLSWSGPIGVTPIDLSPEDYEYLDLTFTWSDEPQPMLHLRTERIPRGTPFDFPQGPYVFSVALYSEDAPTERVRYATKWRTKLFDGVELQRL